MSEEKHLILSAEEMKYIRGLESKSPYSQHHIPQPLKAWICTFCDGHNSPELKICSTCNGPFTDGIKHYVCLYDIPVYIDPKLLGIRDIIKPEVEDFNTMAGHIWTIFDHFGLIDWEDK